MRVVTRVWIALALLVGLMAVAPTATFAKPSNDVRPIIKKRSFPDPSVERFRKGLIAVSTGPRAPRAWLPRPGGAWRNIGPALKKRPAWSTTGKVWAADIVKADGKWLLYYSITVRGLHREGRCIGVAVARTPLQPFVNVSKRPLVCPREAKAPRARDLSSPQYPRKGVIDPSAFVGANGARYLLYKTQGKPSTIRMVRLTRSGQQKMPGSRSREILRVPRTIENPVLVQRRHRFFLFTSEGDYTHCGYHTSWRSASSLSRLSKVRRHRLLSGVEGEVCGPGGADIVDLPSGPAVFYHGWTCYRRDVACPRRFNASRHSGMRSKRSTYAAPLKWAQGKPRAGTAFKMAEPHSNTTEDTESSGLPWPLSLRPALR